MMYLEVNATWLYVNKTMIYTEWIPAFAGMTLF